MKLLPHNVPAGEVVGKELDDQSRIYRRVEITVEREILSVLHQPDSSFLTRCKECGREVLMLTPEAAAVFAGTSAREMYRWLEENKLHFQELSNGKVFICSASLKSELPKELP